MKKKVVIGITIFVIITGILIIFFLFDSRQKELLHYELPTATLDDQIATSNEPMTVAEAAEILAPLTNEDGTGEINLNMTWQEIAAVLDEKGVPYRVSGEWKDTDEEDFRRIFVDYSIIYAPSYGNFTVAITQKGLKMNDSVSVALELYGEPYKIERNAQYDNLYDYYYNMGKLYCNATDSERTVLLNLSVADETVVSIQIKFLDQTNYMGENLEETFWK